MRLSGHFSCLLAKCVCAFQSYSIKTLMKNCFQFVFKTSATYVIADDVEAICQHWPRGTRRRGWPALLALLGCLRRQL